ncbi:hypothetical protein BS333_08985 [Vibrio azureus]|uniref:OmpR/PhoB-type domain-containing protein n=1 Tax=Vibrio azureus NBRC 104587 TaxID=1219077 RepID=U3C6N1_9VIBR|nr:winged helix-turn-helix domain-containing protein [Vibrio azureus]AUI86507.1 hypothetical protein BS333_08985 [Vibrio azureus]GAD74123.1 hypothetical protein VAZ01S_003_00120 [Vibrio azureus NBRC 104587]
MYRIKNWLIDLEHPLAKNILTDEERRIGYHDHLVILILCKNAGKVTTKEELLTGAWPGKHVSEGSLTQSIRSIRQLLEDSGKEQKYLKTVAKIGYKFESDAVFNSEVKEVELSSKNISDSIEPESKETSFNTPQEASLEVETKVKKNHNVKNYLCIVLGIASLLVAASVPFIYSQPKFEASSWTSMHKVEVSDVLTIYVEPDLNVDDISESLNSYILELKQNGIVSRVVMLYTRETFSLVTIRDSDAPQNVVIILKKTDTGQKLVSLIKEELHHHVH